LAMPLKPSGSALDGESEVQQSAKTVSAAKRKTKRRNGTAAPGEEPVTQTDDVLEAKRTPKKKQKKDKPKKQEVEDSDEESPAEKERHGKKNANAGREGKRAAKKVSRFTATDPEEAPAVALKKRKAADITEDASGSDGDQPAKIVKAPGHPLRVFVGGLPKVVDLEEDAVRADFAKCGDIEEFSLPRNKQKIPMGIAFIQYKTKKAAANALKKDGEDYRGKKIGVKIAEGIRQKAKA